MGDLFEEVNRRIRYGRDFKPHSMAQRTEFRCPHGKRRDPHQSENQKKPRCAPAREALGGQGGVVRTRRKKHRVWQSGEGRHQDVSRVRWRKLRAPIKKRTDKAFGESAMETMGDLFEWLNEVDNAEC